MAHKYTLTKGEPDHLSGEQPLNTGQMIGYSVLGMPAGEKAMIKQMDGRWQILHVVKEKSTGWTGDFATDDEALTALQQQINGR